MTQPRFEIVHSILDWYDGARKGVANFDDRPHYYECVWSLESGNWSDEYLLTKINEDTYNLAMEDWNIWLRWEQAFKEGKTTRDTHPSLPEDRERQRVLTKVLKRKSVVSENSIRATAEFKYGKPTLVRWTVVP